MLILPIKRKWFDMILSGEKKEEYRDIKPYYDTRLMDTFGMIWVGDELIRSLSAGYGREEWGAEPGKKYYILTIENIGGMKL